MKIVAHELKGVYEITHDPYRDDRGDLTRLYDMEIFKQAGIERPWCQESYSRTSRRHTVRGIHVSLAPNAEAKVITAIRGTTLWVVVDLRTDSRTFGQHGTFVMSADAMNSLCVARGFAHGCASLTDNCGLLLKADTPFADIRSTGIIWNDDELGIDWQLNGATPQLSPAHAEYPSFAEFKRIHGGISVPTGI